MPPALPVDGPPGAGVVMFAGSGSLPEVPAAFESPPDEPPPF